MLETKMSLYRGRVKNFLDFLKDHMIKDQRVLNAKYFHTRERLNFQSGTSGELKAIKEGEIWGADWESAWFFLEGEVPSSWKDQGNTYLKLHFSGEGLLYNKDGQELRGISSGSVFDDVNASGFHHIDEKAGDKVEYWVEAAANQLFGTPRKKDEPKSNPKRYSDYKARVVETKIALVDEVVKSLFHDVFTLFDLYKHLVKDKNEDSVLAKRLIFNLNKVINIYKSNRENAQEARDLLKPFFDSNNNNKNDLQVYAVGHAHIDTGWLWPVDETVRKVGRTFSTQLYLLEKYKDQGYIFGASQPQLYEFAKERYPNVYNKIKAMVAQDRWELQGGMWVEPDTNLPSGESLVRQVLYGKNFFKDEFGKEVKNLWLPDVFGYSAALPQILKKSGIDYFMTQKISWNQFNKFPRHTFYWEGVDGTSILSHFLPEDTYNSMMHPSLLIHAKKNFKENHFIDSFLSLYGVGDGGGGPKEDIIERALRLKSVDEVPKVKFSKAQDYLESLEKYSGELDKWVGELYLELHRGTYTTQALVKKMNRKLEYKLRNLEFFYSLLPYSDFPQEKMQKIWKLLLINQFHDILPGSSINEVYIKTHKEHKEIDKESDEIIKHFVNRVFQKDENSVVLINTHSFNVKTFVGIDKECSLKDKATILDSVFIEGRSYVLVELKALEIKSFEKVWIKEKLDDELLDVLVFENEFVRYEFSKEGRLIVGILKEGNINLIEKQSNVFSLYEDKPHMWDAWDVDIFYEDVKLEEAKLIDYKVISRSKLKKLVRFNYRISNSSITQDVSLGFDSNELRFDTKVDWDEKHKMLRVGFESTVRASDFISDVQFAYLKRNNHRNTTSDMAKFEVCAHKYIDLSNESYGVSLLNDCKYGHKVLGKTLDINLLRSPNDPDVDADEGEHEFTYSFYPHLKRFLESDVIKRSFVLNNPIVSFDNFKGDFEFPISICEDSSVFVETLKKAEKEDCLILRLVENKGTFDKFKFSLNGNFNKLIETNLIEWEDKNELDGKDFELEFSPFEIKTFKIK